MIAHSRFQFVVLIVSLLSGCVDHDTPQPGSAEALRATPQPITANPAHIIKTPLAPQNASQMIVAVINQLQFINQNQKGDYFKCEISCMDSTGERLVVTCHWISPNETEVTIQSELPKNQDDFVANRIEEQLLRASQPVSGGVTHEETSNHHEK